MSSGSAELSGEAQGAALEVQIADPELWWPNGYGDPALHELNVSATVGGATSDIRRTRFGIREFAYESFAPVVISPPAVPPLS